MLLAGPLQLHDTHGNRAAAAHHHCSSPHSDADKKGNVSLWHVNEGSYELPPAARRAEPILRRGSAQQEQQQRGEGDSGDTEAEEEQGDKPGGQGRGGGAAAVHDSMRR